MSRVPARPSARRPATKRRVEEAQGGLRFLSRALPEAHRRREWGFQVYILPWMLRLFPGKILGSRGTTCPSFVLSPLSPRRLEKCSWYLDGHRAIIHSALTDQAELQSEFLSRGETGGTSRGEL